MNSLAAALPAPATKLTHDGFEVPPHYRLAFTPCAVQRVESCWNPLLEVSLEWQRDGERRRPFLVIIAGPLHIQIGWLWFDPGKKHGPR